MIEIGKKYVAIPPGETMKEQLQDRNMSQKEFALRMGMTEKHISRLINGEVHLTVETARKLELVFGVPAQFWCNLESTYREKILLIKEEKRMDIDIEITKKFPYQEMAKQGWVIETTRGNERARNLKKYFEVVHLAKLQDGLIPERITCQKLLTTEKNYYTLIAWAQKAKLEGRKIKTLPVDIKKIVQILPEIRALSILSPEEFCPKLQLALASCGIATVFLPAYGKTIMHGVTFYDGKKIILGLTVDKESADIFWLNLFCELAHIILGHLEKNNRFLIENKKEAEEYSENVLIPKKDFETYIDNGHLTRESIVEFAKKEGIEPSIVLSMLQKGGYVKKGSYKSLIKQYAIA